MMSMLREYVEIGSTPAQEECAGVGQANYTSQSRRECRAFIGQLRRQFGLEPAGAELSTRRFEHDFGSYYEVVCYFDGSMPASYTYAIRCENECPAYWDREAQDELGIVSAQPIPPAIDGTYQIWLGTSPECEICAHHCGVHVTAEYNAKLEHTEGDWAYMCAECFEEYGIGLGKTRGQKLIFQ